MPQPLVFDLFAHDTFRPADLGWLTPAGVVRAAEDGRNPNDGMMAVRSIGHILAGRRGGFMEVGATPPKLAVGESLLGSWAQQVPWKTTNR